MKLKNNHTAQQCKPLEHVWSVVCIFLLHAASSVALFWLISEPQRDSGICRYAGLLGSSLCTTSGVLLGSAFAVFSGFMAWKAVIDFFDMFSISPKDPFDPTLRVLLYLNRVRLEKVLYGDVLELDFIVMDDDLQAQKFFTLNIKGVQKFNFYNVDNEPVSANCIFRRGALLEFSPIEYSTEFYCARVMVRSLYHGAFYYGQLELEAESYELRALPKPPDLNERTR